MFSYNGWKYFFQAIGKDFGIYLVKYITQANGTKLVGIFRIIYFWYKSNIRMI